MLYKTNNECFSFVQWCKYDHLSTHEHIRTIALINIHYLYTMRSRMIIYTQTIPLPSILINPMYGLLPLELVRNKYSTILAYNLELQVSSTKFVNMRRTLFYCMTSTTTKLISMLMVSKYETL